MEKQGFTLVELLGVIVILAVISLLAFPPIIEQISKSKDELSNAMKEVIYNATDLYTDAHHNEYPKVEGSVYCITVKQLVDNNFLKSPLKDPKTNAPIADDTLIKAGVTNGIFYFDVVKECTGQNNAMLKSAILKNGVVTAGSGLYQMGSNEYRYRGGCNLTGSAGSYSCSDADPVNNYVSINGEIYRIISMDDQGIKIMAPQEVVEKAFDEATGEGMRNNDSNTFCQTTEEYKGCNVYAAPIGGTFTAGSRTGTVTQNSTLYTYLNSTGTEKAIATLRSIAKKATWNIGAVNWYSNNNGTAVDVLMAMIQDDEQAFKAEFQIGLINVSDYILGSLDPTCASNPINYSEDAKTCRNQNWLYNPSTSYPWTINGFTSGAGGTTGTWHSNSNDGYLYGGVNTSAVSVRPAAYLSLDTVFSGGTGTASDPWIIKVS